MPEKNKRPKLTLNQRKSFADYDRRFEKQLEELRKKHPLRNELTKALVEMGEALDKDLYRHSAIKKEAVERLSYKERARRYANKLYSETSREAVMIRRADEGALSNENMIAEMLFGKTDNYKGDDGDILVRVNEKRVLTADTWDTLDVLAHNITELWMENVKRTGELPSGVELTMEEFQEVTKEPDNFVVISWEKYKRLLGKTGWDRKQCEVAVLTLKKLNYSGTLRFPTKDHGQVGFKVADSFASIFIPEDEKSWNWVRESAQFRSQAGALENGGGFIINFTGHLWGTMFLLNVLNREIRMLPKRFYTDLSARARLLFRLTLLGRRGRGTIALEQIVKVEGWKPEVTEDGMRKRLLEIQAIWQELSEAGFIKGVPEPVEKDGVLCWTYEHCADWLSDQKTLGENC